MKLTNEKIYNMVKEKELLVREVINYINKEGKEREQGKKINSPTNFINFVEDNGLIYPNINQIGIVFMNSKNMPIYSTIFTKKDKHKILKRALERGSANYMIVLKSGFNNSDMLEAITNTLKVIGLKELDTFTVDKVGNKFYIESEMAGSKDECNIKHIEKDILHELANILNIDIPSLDFLKYYAKKELEGISIENKSLIGKILRIGYQYNTQEHFGIIGYNDDGNIVQIKDLSIGGLNSAYIDARTVALEFLKLKEQGIKGIILYHNHPSGCPSPSGEDIMMTNTLKELGLSLGIPVTEHVIIGKYGIEII